MRAFRIGQVVGLGFGLILFLALIVGLAGRIAYDISKWQNNIIQTRSDVGNLTMSLEVLAFQRTEALRRYLDSEEERYLQTYHQHQDAYESTLAELQALLRTPTEKQALAAVQAAEAKFKDKAEEILRLYERFPGSANFLWDTEGRAARDDLTQTIEALRQVQGQTNSEIIEDARQTEQLVVFLISIFIFLVFIVGGGAGWIITRSISKPIYGLVQAVSALGHDLSTRTTPTGPKEIAFLGETVNQMAASLATSRQSLQAYKDRLEEELRLASQIQASFLPPMLTASPGLELAVFWQSARQVGGDFYAHVTLTNGQCGLAVGDVSGKGAPAAMAGALAVGMLEAYAPRYPTPEALLAELNEDLCTRLSSRHMNVACCYGIINLTQASLQVANAGCMYPYLRRGSELQEINVAGLPLGAACGVGYQSLSVGLQPGDMLIFSSDGLVEAKNEQNQILGFERLEAALRALPAGISAQAAVDQLVEVALGFTGQRDLHDDITVLVARVVNDS